MINNTAKTARTPAASSKTLGLLTLALTALLGACDSATTSTPLPPAGFGCTASAQLASGNLNSPNSFVRIKDTSVTLYGSTGPFSISIPGLSAFTTSQTTYSYPTAFSVPTGASGGISGTVSVTDTANGRTINCALSVSGGGSTNPSSFILAAVPGPSVSVGVPIVVNVQNPDSTMSYRFSLAAPVTGVSIVQNSHTQATVTSTIATTIVLYAKQINIDAPTDAPAIANASISLTFGGGTGPGSLQITANKTTAGVSTANSIDIIYLTATDPSRVGQTYSFSVLSSPGIITVNPTGSSAQILSTTAGTVTIAVNEIINGAIVASASINLTFVATGGGTGSMTCTLAHSGSTYADYYNPWWEITFTLSSSTGESVQIIALDPGEPWTSPIPLFPLRNPLRLVYTRSGEKRVRMIARSATRPGVYCNDGAVLEDTVTLQLYGY